ncbi:hypothetical protein [Microbacterium azadirachtae]|uniref:DUF732 domain-containing protein n=1 Tax=Microbacterium azadirachtae TaxID=582680 RepID=A0A0F0LGW5_9MICO|nr:hypothetical protein [Microbacterium azadirachtae]KJL30776.1 hypothetical protein RS86_03719 [Microbacterium azadirachtae]
MKRSLVGAASAVLLVLVLAGCTSARPAADAPASTALSKPISTASTASRPAKPAPAPTPTGVDRTFKAQSVGGGIITKAIEEPAGTIRLYTGIAQPFSAPQAPARQEALIACEAVRAQMGASTVIVLDAGEKGFAFFNATNYPECALAR